MTRTPATKTLICLLLLALCSGSGYGRPAASDKRPRKVPLADSTRRTVKSPGPSEAAALKAFEARTGSKAWRVRYNPRTAMPEAVTGARTPASPGGPEQAAMAFLNGNKDFLGVDTGQLRLVNSRTFMGITHLQYEQVYGSVPVEFAYVRVHVNSSGEITGCQSRFEPAIDVPLTPAYPAAQAESAALSDLGFSARVTGTRLVLFPDPEEDGTLKLAWRVRTRAAEAGNGIWIYYIGAADGRVLFRYDDMRYAASGTVRGSVYPISPLPTGSGGWLSPSANVPIRDQYVWVTNSLTSSSRAVTGASGNYASSYDGKVFASLKGPYFSVVNFLGPSAHFDNGSGVWTSYPHSPNIGSVPSADNSYSVTIPQSHWPAGAFAKVLPHFSSFSVGLLDNDGDFVNEDELHLLSGGNAVASYIGSRSAPFFGAPVESPSYGLYLDKRSPDAASFSVDFSSYLVLTDNPLVTSNPTGSINWVPGAAGVSMETLGNTENSQAEVNVFYHLNSARYYFTLLNKDPADPSRVPADISSKQVPVMVHAHDTRTDISNGGMRNAFYDLEADNIFIGDGTKTGSGKYLSFALDGTIIRHEYVHRVVNQIYPIINIGEFGALSEAMADYFSLASLDNREGNGSISVLGNFVGWPRDISGTDAVMPSSWTGEVHGDSLILSQALWELKKDAATFGAPYPAFPGVDKMDALAYAAFFYFPDNFANFQDAMVDACRQLGGGVCPYESKIDSVFAAHGIPAYSLAGDAYDQPVPGTMCSNNNGPECATDMSQRSSVSGTIFPIGDADFYSLPLSEGEFTATLTLPASGSNFQAYAIGVFDADRRHVIDASPSVSNSINGICPLTGDCLTNDGSVTLNHRISSPGRYYLVITAAGNNYSQAPYALSLSFSPKGSAQADVARAVFDRDTISFSVPYAKFAMAYAPSSSTLTGAEHVFQYAQLRDGLDHHPLPGTRTDAPGSYLTISTVTQGGAGGYYIRGSAALSPGFTARFPAAGSVCLEVFGRNHMGSVVSLGVSNTFNLTAAACDMVVYNNVLTGSAPAAARIRYGLMSRGELSVKIYTVTGTLVKTVYDGVAESGKGNLSWDGRNEDGSKAASGIYYVRAKSDGCEATEKIAVVR